MALAVNRWAEVNGVSLRYRITGTGDQTWVLVHEMAGMIESWDGVAPLLETDARVVCYDQRGFGLSEKGVPITLPAMVQDLAALLDELRITTPVCLAAGALGAAICLAFVIAYPQRVQCMVLSSPATGGMPPAARTKLEEWLTTVATQGIRPIVDPMFAITYPSSLPCPVAAREQHRRRWLGVDPESFIALSRMLLDVDLVQDLPRIGCPTLIIGCTHDSIRSPARCAELAALMPRGSFVTAASGHYMPIQTPELFAAQLGSMAHS
jgi:3-oxoadipate enol-lactonase